MRIIKNHFFGNQNRNRESFDSQYIFFRNRESFGNHVFSILGIGIGIGNQKKLKWESELGIGDHVSRPITLR